LDQLERLLRAVLPAACILVLLTALLLPWDEGVHSAADTAQQIERLRK
jgi:hypothetical protein